MALRVLILAVALAFLLVTGLELPGRLGAGLSAAGAVVAVLALFAARRRDRPGD